MKHSNTRFITGILSFWSKKITLTDGDIEYFVQPISVRSGYVHGDLVRARITKRDDGSRLAEVEVQWLIHRSREIILAEVMHGSKGTQLKVLKDMGNLMIPMPREQQKEYIHGQVLRIKWNRDWQLSVLGIFARTEDYDYEEQRILFLSHVRIDWDDRIRAYEASLRAPEILEHRGEHMSDGFLRLWEQFFGGKNDLQPDTKNDPTQPWIREVSTANARVDFRNWYTMTIDGSTAKDLDDAVSIARYEGGDLMLAVHIADVAEYVTEGDTIDIEAEHRATSIYTPDRVIPMLPEALSNNLCSLHPGTPKLVLSCLMRVRPNGEVVSTELVEGVIESNHRGIYDEIFAYHTANQSEKNPFSHTVELLFDLYEILKKRRAKEWKIIFESSEPEYVFAPVKENDKQTGRAPKVPIRVELRSRNAAHMLIEECMVLANEEVAKWCDAKKIPFLSRVHGLPASSHLEIISAIIQNPDAKKSLEPAHIRAYMDTLRDEPARYRLSRLILPKMAKANYSDVPFRHFGLALGYYAHFTSPIRRYPDLQVHRIIKEELHKTLSEARRWHYKKILKRIARHCSKQERSAEDVERAFDALYNCRYMAGHIGENWTGRVSGMTDWAVFVELSNGIEVTILLERKHYSIDLIMGSLRTHWGKILYTIGQPLEITLSDVNMYEKRIYGKIAV